MKNITILLFTLMFNYADAQSWQWQNPQPHGNIISCVKNANMEAMTRIVNQGFRAVWERANRK